jgi:putative toxin-antitoxin system antitoxin component (TIGR02293 family)
VAFIKRKARDPGAAYAPAAAVLGADELEIDSQIGLHEQIARGLPRSTIVHLLAELQHISQEEALRALNISPRTFHRIKADSSAHAEPLDVDQSARAWSLAEVLAKAGEVLGSRDDAEQWMVRPAIGLEARRPIDLMATPQGAELVKTLLERMAHGVYA